MNETSLKRIRILIKLFFSLIFFWIYLPHLMVYAFNKKARHLIKEDVIRELESIDLRLNIILGLLLVLHTNRYFRTLFYHRIGFISAVLIGWWRPGDKYFIISNIGVLLLL